MKNNFEKPVNEEVGKKLFEKLHGDLRDAEQSQNPEPTFQTGTGAMDEWQKKQEALADSRAIEDTDAFNKMMKERERLADEARKKKQSGQEGV